MATTPQTVYEPHAGGPSTLQEKARRHLWMHFTRMGAYDDEHEIPIIVRGEGSYVYDEHDKRYLDGLSALFCVNAGHGRAELGEAAAAQAKKLGFYFAHIDSADATVATDAFLEFARASDADILKAAAKRFADAGDVGWLDRRPGASG